MVMVSGFGFPVRGDVYSVLLGKKELQSVPVSGGVYSVSLGNMKCTPSQCGKQAGVFIRKGEAEGRHGERSEQTHRHRGGRGDVHSVLVLKCLLSLL